LANEIIELLSNNNKQQELAERAMKYALNEFDNANSVNLLIKAYKAVIKDFKNEH
jgi:glycosyltransferase involved in cell wall biosynthesis